MANPTTNFGWVMPTSADLVTDLPADFAVFGQGVDTTMAELKGGTTGQSLTKTSATDMDFTWAGPLGMTLLSTTSITNIASVSITGISGNYKDLVVILENAATVSTSVTIRGTLNTDAGSRYSTVSMSPGSASVIGSTGVAYFELSQTTWTQTANTNNINARIHIPRYAATAGYKIIKSEAVGLQSSASALYVASATSTFNQTPAITSIQLFPSTGNWTAQGTIYVYGLG